MHSLGPLRITTFQALTVITTMTVALPPPFASIVLAATLAPSSDDLVGDLMARADEKRADESYLESATLYSEAYHALSEADQLDEIGELNLRNAMTDYDRASEAAPKNRALLEAQRALLDDFLSTRERARTIALAKKSKTIPEVPLDLIDELQRLDDRISALNEYDTPEAEDENEDDEDQLVVDTPDQESGDVEAKPEIPPPIEPKPARARKGGAAILTVGLVSFAGGGVVAAIGAWDFVQTDRRARARLTALDAEELFSDEQRQTYRASLDDWYQGWHKVSTALIAGGAALAATGVGFTAWGIVRIRNQRQRTSNIRTALLPAVARQHVGALFVLEF